MKSAYSCKLSSGREYVALAHNWRARNFHCVVGYLYAPQRTWAVLWA